MSNVTKIGNDKIEIKAANNVIADQFGRKREEIKGYGPSGMNYKEADLGKIRNLPVDPSDSAGREMVARWIRHNETDTYLARGWKPIPRECWHENFKGKGGQRMSCVSPSAKLNDVTGIMEREGGKLQAWWTVPAVWEAEMKAYDRRCQIQKYGRPPEELADGPLRNVRRIQNNFEFAESIEITNDSVKVYNAADVGDVDF